MDELWRYLTEHCSPFVLYTIVPTLLVNAVYVVGALLCLSLDYVPTLRKYKIQTKYNPASAFFTCVKYLVLVKLLVEIPMTMASYPLLRAVGVRADLPLPSMTTVLLSLVAFFFIEDAWHYFAHRSLHSTWAYKKIHYLHHTYTTPFGVGANYAHPVETIWTGFGTILPILIFRPHLYTMIIWICVRQVQAIAVHVGYDLPFSLRRWVPLVAGASSHDKHHTKYNYNFAPLFTHMDWIFGTAWPKGKA